MGRGHIWCFDLVMRIVVYFVVIHNNFFEHFCVARYWHDESSCTLAELKRDSWNSVPMYFDSNIARMLGVEIYRSGKIPRQRCGEGTCLQSPGDFTATPKPGSKNIGDLPPRSSIKRYAYGYCSPSIISACMCT